MLYVTGSQCNWVRLSVRCCLLLLCDDPHNLVWICCDVFVWQSANANRRALWLSSWDVTKVSLLLHDWDIILNAICCPYHGWVIWLTCSCIFISASNIRPGPMFLALDFGVISASPIFKDTLSRWNSWCLLPSVGTVFEFQVICMHPLVDLLYACFQTWHCRLYILWVTGHMQLCAIWVRGHMQLWAHGDVWRLQVCIAPKPW